MENVNIDVLENGRLYLTPFVGYKLHNIRADKYYTEAVAKNPNGWEAVRDEDIPVPERGEDDIISDAEALNIILGEL